MLGVTFGSKHSYNDWGIWLEDTHINPPLPKRYIVDVPARNGLLDLTPELTPTIRFENRTLTFNFRVKAGDWSTLMSQIYGQIHGQTLDVISDLDPQWHWHGCVTVDDFSSDERTGVLVITVDADPFKLSNTDSSYTVNGNGTITCVVDRMEISPAFEIEAPTTVIYGDSSYVIESTATTEKTLSGDIVSFVDGTANPAVDLTADIDAVQDLHSYDYPWVGGAGKNIFDYDQFKNASGWTESNGTYSGNLSNLYAYAGYGTAFPTPPVWKANTQYTLSVNVVSCAGIGRFRVVYSDDSYTDLVIDSSTGYKSSTTTSGKTISKFFFTYNTNGACSIKEFQIEEGTSRTTWQPYENICPISGWDEVNVNVVGKNLFGGDFFRDGIKNAISNATDDPTNRTISFAANASSSQPFTTVIGGLFKPNTQYTFILKIHKSAGSNGNANMRINYSDGTYTTIDGFTEGETVTNYKRSSANKTVVSLVKQNSGGTTTLYYDESGIFEGALTTADFVPFDGVTHTTDLDGTRYGGTLDVTTGVLTVTWVADTFDGTENWSWYSTTNQIYGNFLSHTAKYGDGTEVTYMCDTFKPVSNSQRGSNIGNYATLVSSGAGIGISTPATNATDAKAILASNPTTFVYELATPQTVQLTAEQVMILKNQNNIWADSGEVEVTYLAQDFAGRKFFIPDLELTEGSHSLTIQGTGTTKVTYTNGRL